LQEVSWRKTKQNVWKCLTCRKKPEDLPVAAEELRKFMADVSKKLEPVGQMSKTVQELKQSVDFMSSKYDELLKKVADLEKEGERKSDEVSELKKTVQEKDKVIDNLMDRMKETEQYARNKNIEVSGVEAIRGENLITIMENIAEKINVDFSVEDIDIIHRVPTRRGDGPPKIIAQFTNRKTRNIWLKNKRNAVIHSDEITTGQSKAPVYLNSHLTAEWKALLWRTKEKGRPRGYQAIWFQDNKIYAKKNLQDTRPIIIRREDDLQYLI
jgi:predicted RNase H-like nuclease (RuvC/YqgF family)